MKSWPTAGDDDADAADVEDILAVDLRLVCCVLAVSEEICLQDGNRSNLLSYALKRHVIPRAL